MYRAEARNYVMKATRRLPNREKCRYLTSEEVRLVSRKVDLAPIEAFLETNYLNFRKADLTQSSWFKLILMFVLNTDWMDNQPIYYPDDKIWDTSDPKTVQQLDKIKANFGFSGEMASMRLENLLSHMR